MGNRIKIELEMLKENRPINIGELRLEMKNRNVLEVTGWSQYKNFDNLTKQKTLNELKELKDLFIKIVNAFPTLKNFIVNKSIIFNLYFDDYGKASIPICSEKNCKVEWMINLK